MDLHLISSEGRGAFDWQEEMLAAAAQPIRNALNVHWIHSIAQKARSAGVRTLLTGDPGNLTLSYDGAGIYGEALRSGQLRELARLILQSSPRWRGRLRHFLRGAVAPNLPRWAWTLHARRRTGQRQPWLVHVAATEQALARRGSRLRAGDVGFDFFVSPPRDLRDYYFRMLDVYFAGTAAGFTAAARCIHDVDIRNPLVDRRLIEWCFSIPHEQFRLGGQPRALAKRVAEGLLPEDIRLQRHGRGIQTADAHLRLSRDRDRMIQTIETLRLNDEIADLIDLDRLSDALRDWPAAEAFWEDRGRAAYLSAVVPMALQAGRFLQRESGRNV
jgi:asparagine synthase (glutamine-hydrolysing)